MSAHRLVVRSTNTTMAATAPDDEMAITQPAAMSMERESAKDVISAKSLHGCSGDLFVYAVWICGPGFSCIGPHPSAPDSEDVYARRALHGPPMCAYVTNERWERVDRTNTFRRTEGNGGCCAGDNNIGSTTRHESLLLLPLALLSRDGRFLLHWPPADLLSRLLLSAM